MQVQDGMSAVVVSVGPGHTLRETSRLMDRAGVGAAVVVDPEAAGVAIFTERDLLASVAAGERPEEERVADHLTTNLVYASPDWSLEEASVAMVRGGFRHLVVLDGSEVVGVLSMRDIVRCWTQDGADCEVPAGTGQTT